MNAGFEGVGDTNFGTAGRNAHKAEREVAGSGRSFLQLPTCCKPYLPSTIPHPLLSNDLASTVTASPSHVANCLRSGAVTRSIAKTGHWRKAQRRKSMSFGRWEIHVQ